MGAPAGQLEVTDLEVRRGAACLVEGLSFNVTDGQRALIVGRNGTGKTSLLRILAGIAPVTAGEIRLGGKASQEWGPEERALLAYRGHLNGIKLDLTGRENIAFYAGIRGEHPDPSAWIDELRLQHVIDRPVRQLSAGQRRRVGLAVLRAVKASVWLLDEPITNLDAEGRDIVAAWLDAHTAAGGMAVIATHNPERIAAPGAILVEL